ncbi:hypothetical protein CVV65_12300 [Kyrpidia spormannii]|uniref:Uncharacterized protein n=1 Tax=Kyrpidia spormannii TaxID=2055160 RepID=A0A2K8N8F1_9BACL|nr:hypothetical protein CVV65_12300 [Kyrpidia spormannii]
MVVAYGTVNVGGRRPGKGREEMHRNHVKLALVAFLFGTSLVAGVPGVLAQDTAPVSGHVAHPSHYADPLVQKVIDTAETQIGTPYKWGTNKLRGDSTFDCSNFTQYVYQTAVGYRFSSGSKNQGDLNQYRDWGVYYNIRDIKAGDLLFFSTSNSGGKVGHVGIALEDGTLKIIHTYSPKVPLGEYDYTNNKWWTSHFLYARRPLNHVRAASTPSTPVQSPPAAPVTDSPGSAVASAPSGATDRVTPVKGWVSVRSAPSTLAPRVAVLHLGESAERLATVNDWWYKVRLSDGTVGYLTSSPRYVQTQ